MNVSSDRTVCRSCGRVFTAGERFCPFDRSDLDAQPQEPEEDPLIGTVVAGAYTLLSRLGAGGMGVVYKARQNRLERNVALKVLSPRVGGDRAATERFRKEALAVSQLSNPHTVSIHDFGATEDGLLYLVMALVEGETLRSRIGRGPLDPRAAVMIAIHVCESLAEAHERRPMIVHRDIKPDNIIVHRTAHGDEFAVVLDFGLAKLADADSLTASGLIVGTPAYMAPEQARSDGSFDWRVDLYALGVVLYEMLSGHAPFSAATTAALLYKHVWEVPPPLSVVSPQIALPPRLERLVLDLLTKNPGDRVQTAAIARARLLEVLEDLPRASGESREAVQARATNLTQTAARPAPNFLSPGASGSPQLPATQKETVPGIATPPRTRSPVISDSPRSGAPGVTRAVVAAPPVRPRAPPTEAALRSRGRTTEVAADRDQPSVVRRPWLLAFIAGAVVAAVISVGAILWANRPLNRAEATPVPGVVEHSAEAAHVETPPPVRTADSAPPVPAPPLPDKVVEPGPSPDRLSITLKPPTRETSNDTPHAGSETVHGHKPGGSHHPKGPPAEGPDDFPLVADPPNKP